MSVILNTNASFSSKQELLDPQEYPPTGPSLDTPSPVDSETGSPIGSGHIIPSSNPPHIFTGSSTLPGQLHGVDTNHHAHTPLGLELNSTDSNQRYGWGALTPKILQVINTPHWVLFFLSVAGFLQGMIVNGLINTVITSIERRFELRSYHSGLIASSYDIATCSCVAFVSYFGGTGHKPRWLGWGVLILGLGSLVFALPHFTTPPYQASLQEQTGMCPVDNTSLCQGEEGMGLTSYYLVFMLSQFLHGVGATPLYTLGVTYLDENVKSNHAPLYIGIFYTASIIGPAAGYLMGGYFLTFYTEIHLMTDMKPDNPLWVGAWWIGFIAAGAAALLLALPILGFPRQLAGSQESVSTRVSEAHQLNDGSQATVSDPQFGKSVKDMPRSVLLLLKNPTFLFLCFAGAMEATLLTAMSTFGPKFLESQFNISASEAATLFGYMVVPAGGGGTFLGGYIVKSLKLRCRGIINFCIMCAVVSLLATFIFLVHCPNLPMAGITASYQSDLMEQHKLNLSNPLEESRSKMLLKKSSYIEDSLIVGCNANCGCVREIYNPVCGADGILYYSPCHAGCRFYNNTKHSSGKQVYSGCSCVVGNVSWMETGFALAGKCDSSCQHMSLFLVFLFICISFTFLCSIPALTATLRCVPDSQRSFALGIQWVVMRVFGSIPGPIAFGSAIDISCLLWQDQCGEQGSCYLYHNPTMSKYTLLVGVICKVLGTVFFLLANVLYKPPPESPHSSCESTEQASGKLGDLPAKYLPEDGVIVNPHAKF